MMYPRFRATVTPVRNGANLTAESSVSIEPCRTYTPLSTNVCRIATANHKIDLTTQRSDAALIRDVSQVSADPFESLCRSSLALHVPTASSARCSRRFRNPPNTKEKRTQESIAPNKLRVATLGSQQQTKETCLTLQSQFPDVYGSASGFPQTGQN